jgi:hypothetical protein
MRRLRLCFCLAITTVLFPVGTLAVDSTTTSVQTHLEAISWFTGTFHCTGQAVYSNGKVRRDATASTLTISKQQNGWMRSAFKGQPGFASFGYDPKKGRYVFLSIGGPGEYAAGYFTVTRDHLIMMEFPDLMDNEVYSAGDFQKFTPTSNGYQATAAGPSDTYPGVHYKATYHCARQ